MAAQRYRLVSFDRQMGIGVAGSMQVSVSAVAKKNGAPAPYCVPNEMICAELGRFLRLPVPPCGIVRVAAGDPTPWFASMDFNLTGNSLPPVDPARCWAALPLLSAGLLLFDVLIGNCDRHRTNFAVDFSANPPTMSVFDHSHALFGFASGQGQARLADLRERLAVSGGSHSHGNRHCLLDVITSDGQFADWFSRVRALPDYLIEDLCHDATELGATAQEADEAIRFLKHRRDRLPDIVAGHRSEFHGIQQWSLFP
jgi:hypothetical protein